MHDKFYCDNIIILVIMREKQEVVNRPDLNVWLQFYLPKYLITGN